jgi:hypothetical protein
VLRSQPKVELLLPGPKRVSKQKNQTNTKAVIPKETQSPQSIPAARESVASGVDEGVDEDMSSLYWVYAKPSQTNGANWKWQIQKVGSLKEVESLKV